MFSDFRSFLMRGNLVDLVVGLTVGIAFKDLVTSFVQDVLMPPIGFLIGGMDFRDLQYVLKPETKDVPGVAIRYGAFIQTIIDFIIIALVIFMVVKIYERMMRNKKKQAPLDPSLEVLCEIRDIIKKQ